VVDRPGLGRQRGQRRPAQHLAVGHDHDRQRVDVTVEARRRAACGTRRRADVEVAERDLVAGEELPQLLRLADHCWPRTVMPSKVGRRSAVHWASSSSSTG
jgi:hypothetical protein